MKLGPGAIQGLYPQFSRVECEAHGEQPRGRVPKELEGVFKSRSNPDWVCGQCLDDAKAQLAQTKRELKQAKQKAKEDRREAIKKSREDAKNADKALAEYVIGCQTAVDAVKTAENNLNTTREKIKTAKNRAEGAEQRLHKAREDYHAHASAVLQLEELSSDQFEQLDCTDADVATCYNALQEKLSEADALWESLGKAAKKKRIKDNRKSAMALLKERNDVLASDGEPGTDGTGTDVDGSDS